MQSLLFVPKSLRSESLQPEALALYRRALRAASRAFDPNVRSFAASYTRQRYEDARIVTVSAAQRKVFALSDEQRIRQSIIKLLRVGRLKVSQLERANEGDHKSRQRMLELAYGRMGPVRHALIDQYREPTETESVTISGKQYHPVLIALLESSIANQGAKYPWHSPHIPQTSSPMPINEKRINRRKREYYDKLVNKVILAPLAPDVITQLEKWAKVGRFSRDDEKTRRSGATIPTCTYSG
ncbi:hypothetical protein GQ42DRAFT_180888 [Ramicandelaber brevisporus]|nr:hypothetical protein GQ42DRAFT_180888 [Ramicandelaber brevisporus]